jgi:hypothetical protein
MSPERRRRLAALARVHHEWTMRHLASSAFHPDKHPKPGSDYNQHHLDIEATPEQLDELHSEARRVMGIAP